MSWSVTCARCADDSSHLSQGEPPQIVPRIVEDLAPARSGTRRAREGGTMRLQSTLAAFLGTMTAASVGTSSPDDPSKPPDPPKGGEISAPQHLAPGKAAIVFAHGFGGSSTAWDQ